MSPKHDGSWSSHSRFEPNSEQETAPELRPRGPTGAQGARRGGIVLETREVSIAIDASASIATAAELKTRLLDALGQGAPVALDAGQATGCDTATAQLLIAAVRAAARRGLTVRWREASEAFSDSVERLGVAADLGLPEAGSTPGAE